MKTYPLIVLWALFLSVSCKKGLGPNSPEEEAKFQGAEASAQAAADLPIGGVEANSVVLGNEGGVADGSSQGSLPPGTNQQDGNAPGTPNPSTPPPAPPPPPAAAPFYPSSCAAIKKAKADAVSGTYKIYLNANQATRIALDASCDMSEDGGGWTLILNYVHKANSNPPLAIKTQELPLLAGDTLGTDESALTKNWGQAAFALVDQLAPSELRFYCRSSQNSRIIHFKSNDANCLTAARKGTGSCSGLRTVHTKLTGHTGILPALADSFTNNEAEFALTKEPFSKIENGFDTSWSIRGNNDDAWECDFGSNTFTADTIHRLWFR